MPLILLIGFLEVLAAVSARGPHHPRGEQVAKHHVHYRPTKGHEQKITSDAELIHDREHLQEHLENVIEEIDLSNLTNEELEFYYFQVHDVDKNSKLDGLEILQAIQHTTHQSEEHEDSSEESSTDDFDYYVELIDQLLQEDDMDNDGYLSYPEFAAGTKKAAINIQPSVQVVK